MNASFGAFVAIIDGLALWALGVPAPAVWAILALVTNFIPNIGFVLGLVPPAILAFVVGGLPLLLLRELLLGADPAARWMRWLSGDRDAAPPPASSAPPPPVRGADADAAPAQETPSGSA